MARSKPSGPFASFRLPRANDFAYARLSAILLCGFPTLGMHSTPVCLLPAEAGIALLKGYSPVSTNSY